MMDKTFFIHPRHNIIFMHMTQMGIDETPNLIDSSCRAFPAGFFVSYES